jgi:hypothetical protein
MSKNWTRNVNIFYAFQPKVAAVIEQLKAEVPSNEEKKPYTNINLLALSSEPYMEHLPSGSLMPTINRDDQKDEHTDGADQHHH